MELDAITTEVPAAPESAHTSSRKSARSPRIELITRGERRRRWTTEQKQTIAAQSLAPGASPTEVARQYGISSGQLYTWRQALLAAQPEAATHTAARFARVELKATRMLERVSQEVGIEASSPVPQLLASPTAQPSGRIEIVLADGTTVRMDAHVDELALPCAGGTARMINLPSGACIWLACGRTDMRKGIDGLAMLAQQVLMADPFDGAIFAFRGKRGGLVKLLWCDGQGMCLFSKRLETGHFVWPVTETCRVSLTPAQLSMLLEGIDWRMPVRVRRPERAEYGCSRQIHWLRFATTPQAARVFTAPTVLPDDPTALQLILHAALAEIERLRLLIAGLQRNRFGRRSERLDDAAFQQEVENLEQSLAEQVARLDAASSAAAISTPEPKLRPPRTEPAKRNRGALPAHLPRIAVVIDVDDKACPCCGGSLHVIGEDRAEMLDCVPAQVQVRLIRRPRYGCRACEEAVVQAPAPERPIDGGMATEALLAHVLVNKYADHLPLYRQAQIFARQGVTLDRSTLCTWVGRACWWLAPLHELMLSTVLTSPKVFADDTTLPVLDPGRGRTKTGRLWCYAVDNRPWRGPGHPAAAYVYSEDRKSIRRPI